jgi:peptidoglycan hydrolase CwlO-like protein
MSDDERNLRLENALATLAELSANHERRVARLEESFVTLVELTRSHNDGMDELRAAQAELSVAQAESEQKLAALVDAQIRGEEAMKELRSAQAETDRKIAALADAHIHTEDALARLTERVNDILQNGRNGQSQT